MKIIVNNSSLTLVALLDPIIKKALNRVPKKASLGTVDEILFCLI